MASNMSTCTFLWRCFHQEPVFQNGKLMYQCRRPQCNGKVIKESSVFNHKQTNKHQKRLPPLPCFDCGDHFSRSDALGRHVDSGKCLRNQAKAKKLSQSPIVPAAWSTRTCVATTPVTMPQGPFNFEAPGPSMSSVSYHTVTPPMPTRAEKFLSAPAQLPVQAPIPESRSIPQQPSGPPGAT
ncbi:hypothetical protein EV702DRAFT_1157211 [Suillus placidus]|uniref:C2H2-type domain-containing protein n=1 Tax=Suillus placidus TaxID=48579 RepID=A0A9P6ZFG2_9AGAM|nr:hypothetical protein EV702DRAFT_1157211 [Suillus placidus]